MYLERDATGRLVWNWSVIIDTNLLVSKLNYHAEQFNDMRFERGADHYHPGCFAKVTNFHHEMLDMGKFIDAVPYVNNSLSKILIFRKNCNTNFFWHLSIIKVMVDCY